MNKNQQHTDRWHVHSSKFACSNWIQESGDSCVQLLQIWIGIIIIIYFFQDMTVTLFIFLSAISCVQWASVPSPHHVNISFGVTKSSTSLTIIVWALAILGFIYNNWWGMHAQIKWRFSFSDIPLLNIFVLLAMFWWCFLVLKVKTGRFFGTVCDTTAPSNHSLWDMIGKPIHQMTFLDPRRPISTASNHPVSILCI